MNVELESESFFDSSDDEDVEIGDRVGFSGPLSGDKITTFGQPFVIYDRALFFYHLRTATKEIEEKMEKRSKASRTSINSRRSEEDKLLQKVLELSKNEK